MRSSIKRSLLLVAGFLVACGILRADGSTPQPVVLNVGPAANAGLVQFTLNASDGSGAMLNVQTLVASGDSAAVVAAKVVATVTASGGSTWSAQASYGGAPGAVTFAYNSGTGYVPVIRITNLRNSAGALMSLAVAGPGNVSIVFNAGSSGGNQSSLTVRVGGVLQPFSYRLFGQSASTIADALAAYLTNAGVSYSRGASNRIDVYLGPVQSSLSLVTNDPGLQGQVTLSESWTSSFGRGGTDK